MRIIAILCCGMGFLQTAFADDAVFAPPSSAEVRDRVLNDLRMEKAPEDVLTVVSAWWNEASATQTPDALLALAVRSWAEVDPALKDVLMMADLSDPAAAAKLKAVTDRAAMSSYRQYNLRSYFGRGFAELRLYDEAMEQFRSMDHAQLIDPAATFFFQAAAAQSLLQMDVATEALNRLLKQTQNVPPRYKSTAELMLAEIEQVEEKSLDAVARRMSDSERRLDLGRSGEQVQGVQERIIADLDELIKRIEAQMGGGGGNGNGGAPNDPSNPAQDSSVKGSTAPGEVDKKKFSKEGQWGNLPEKKQAEAKNLINRNYPSHYRQAVESYFKKLAGRPAAPGK